MRAGKQMTLTAAHTEGIPHVEFIMGGDYDEFCRVSLMQPIGSQLDDFQGLAPYQPLGTRSSWASGPSTRTPRRRPMTDPTSFRLRVRLRPGLATRLVLTGLPGLFRRLPGRFTRTWSIYAFLTAFPTIFRTALQFFERSP
ncbi:hypothetical protein JCGZ_02785 [Jatropha curcas]|uniref:Uncharacterized protein n=1 Tax=Jatropha curcas TaxID=180498 RepID=A0A067JT82_JATCU|nr:hypothetical protein JCGZ_02785 [Jatropha curcas]